MSCIINVKGGQFKINFTNFGKYTKISITLNMYGNHFFGWSWPLFVCVNSLKYEGHFYKKIIKITEFWLIQRSERPLNFRLIGHSDKNLLKKSIKLHWVNTGVDPGQLNLEHRYWKKDLYFGNIYGASISHYQVSSTIMEDKIYKFQRSYWLHV